MIQTYQQVSNYLYTNFMNITQLMQLQKVCLLSFAINIPFYNQQPVFEILKVCRTSCLIAVLLIFSSFGNYSLST